MIPLTSVEPTATTLSPSAGEMTTSKPVPPWLPAPLTTSSPRAAAMSAAMVAAAVLPSRSLAE
jgi:hypothetical protein